MTTSCIAFGFPAHLRAGLRRSWPVALAEAVVSAMAALLLRPNGIDPEIGVAR
jgi:hypothetical protein